MQTTLDKRAFGLRIENRAETWFTSKYPRARLVARNFTCKSGEIDLIFDVAGELVFVEVRARVRGAWVSGIESVTLRKRKRLERAIGVFLSRYRGSARTLRVDVLVFEMESGMVSELVWDQAGESGSWIHYPNVRLD